MRPKYSSIIGIDEVGRGPIAGPVTVCAVRIYDRRPLFAEGIKDSKKLSAEARECWFKQIKILQKAGKLDYKVTFASERLIDKQGIVAAIQKCLDKCLAGLEINPRECLVLLDGGLHAAAAYKNQETIIKGDEKEPAIALASIIAKVARDKRMITHGKRYPKYGFEQHKGYGTAAHYEAIKKWGLHPLHRRTFV